MSNFKNIIKNGVFSLIYQIVTIILNLLTRTCFLQYVGVELLGINSTFSSILNTLSLAELGFQTAITYHLYEPIEKNNKKIVNQLMNIYRKVYHFIALIILFASFLVLPFLQYFLKGVTVTNYIYIIFIIQALNTVFSYILSYKRTLLFADKKDYICKAIDVATNIIFSILKIVSLVVYAKYEYYLIITIIQTVVANLSIHIICNKLYPYLNKEKIDKNLFKKVFVNVKDVFAAKISNYVYSSTDNIIISSMISSVAVGLVVNYTTIIIQLKSLISLLLNPVIPIIGRSLVSNNNNLEKKIDQFNFLTFFRYCLILLIVVPTYILLEDFIIMWIGSDYLLSRFILILLIVDFYISIIYAPCFDYLNAAGLFKQERNVMIVAAIMNIVLSIIFTLFIGLSGVLLGTVITQLFLWISRSLILFLNYFNDNSNFKKYWIKQIYYIFIFIISIILCSFIHQLVTIENPIFNFIICGICCEIVAVIVYIIFLSRSQESKYLIQSIKLFLKI